MKILMVDKFYFIKGGSERYFFELSEILKKHGHEVIPFAMRHPKNFPSDYQDYFVDNIEFNLDSNWQKIKNSLKIASRVIYSFHARRKIEQLIEKTKPDIAHLHMIEHQLSPSILHSLKKYNIPVLLTAHQLKLICPNYRLFNWNTKKICEKCLNGHSWYPIFEKCHKNSRWAGALISLEAYIHKLMKIYRDNVDIYHVPSKFFGKKFVEAGIDSKKVEQLYYTIRISDYTPRFENKDYFVYFGRLEEAKGLLTLLHAVEKVKSSQLYIVGEGDHRKELEEFVERRAIKNVKFLGAKWGEELKEIISFSKFVIIPSECYDNSPLVIYESYAMGKPVIGSNIGGIPELIDHEKTGLIFEPGNDRQLSEQINYLLDRPQVIIDYGIQARAKAEKEFSPEFHYQEMLKKYTRLLQRN